MRTQHTARQHSGSQPCHCHPTNSLPLPTRHAARTESNCRRVYVHCTAGLGRAPAVCIAWLYWYGPYLSLGEAYKHLTDIRPCGPNRDAIRGATYDILDDRWADFSGGLVV